MGIMDFFSQEAGQKRRAALDEFGRDIGYYVPPELRGLLGFIAEATPTASLERAAQAGGQMLAPGRTVGQRVGDLGTMLSETAGVVAPAMVASKAAMPAAQALQESLLGVSVAADDAGRKFVERMNQRGPVPTMYSNPLMRAGDDGVVEKPLIAQHNLSSEGVRAAADIGGIPMPSLAVSRADYPLEKFGDITLLADPATIKPSRTTGVWDADVYTGRQPRGDVQFVNDRAASKALENDPDFGHMRDISYFMDSYDDFSRANDAMKLAQVGKSVGVDPKAFDNFYDYTRAVDREIGYKRGDVFEQMPGLLSYGETERVLYPAERFTPSGNRRKPSPYTLENVLKYMKGEKAGLPATENMGSGPAKFRAASANRFRNLSEVKSARDRIAPREATEKAFDSFNDDYFKLLEKLSDKFGGGFRGMDSAGALLEDVASGRNYRDWFDGELSPDTLAEIRNLSKRAAELPTNYFEAKPQRSVPLSEFPAAIVPEKNVEAQDLLRQSGVKNILTYGSPEERAALFKKFPELLFSVGGLGGPVALGLLSMQPDRAQTEQDTRQYLGGLLQ